jgi:stearoyl-CoA desaturase (delta-9 desaturase)
MAALFYNALLVVGVGFTVTQIATFSTSIYLHRALTHVSIVVGRPLAFIFRAILWLTTGQIRQEWVAVHSKHHTFTDKPGDPHSPRLRGFGKTWLLNFYYYWREASNPKTVETYASHVKEDRLDRWVFSHGLLGLALGISFSCLLFGWRLGLLIAGLHAFLYVFVAAPLINVLGHWRGAQNFDNTARNSWFLALLTAGESLHNNHHGVPRAPRFSMAKGEIDPSWGLIRLGARWKLLVILMKPVDIAGRRPASV